MKKFISILIAVCLIFSAFPGVALADSSGEKELYLLFTDLGGAGTGGFELPLDGSYQKYGFAIGNIDDGVYIKEILKAEDLEIVDQTGKEVSPFIFDSFDGKYYSMACRKDVDVLDRFTIRYAGKKEYNLIDEYVYVTFSYTEAYAEKLASEIDDFKLDITVSSKPKYNLITWNKDYADNVDGYSILRSASEKGKYKEVYRIENPKVFQCKDSYELIKDATYYYKVRGYKNIDSETVVEGLVSNVKSAKAKKTTTVTKSTIKNNPQYYGLPADFAKPSSLKTNKDYINYILYNFLTCNYSMKKGFFTKSGAREYGEKILSLINPLATTCTDLMGGWVNSDVRYKIKKEKGKYYCSFYSEGAIYSNSTLYDQQVKGLRKAIHIVDQLHQSKLITNRMTDVEKVNFYYHYLLTNYQTPDSYNGSIEVPGGCMEQDTVYACLIKQTAYCSGKAAAFNLLMQLEGIESEVFRCWFKEDAGTSMGHVLNKCKLGGKTFYIDWGSNIPLMTPTEFKKKFVPDPLPPEFR